MRTAVVKLGDIAAMPGQPLHAGFWADRQEDEDYAAWRHRKDLETKLEALLRSLTQIQAKAERLLRTVRTAPGEKSHP